MPLPLLPDQSPPCLLCLLRCCLISHHRVTVPPPLLPGQSPPCYCASSLQTKPVVRLVAQQPNGLAKKVICVTNVGWLAGPKPVGAQSALVWAWQLAGARGVQNQHTPNWLATGWCGARAQPTGWQLAGSTDTAKQTLEWAMALANSLIVY